MSRIIELDVYTYETHADVCPLPEGDIVFIQYDGDCCNGLTTAEFMESVEKEIRNFCKETYPDEYDLEFVLRKIKLEAHTSVIEMFINEKCINKGGLYRIYGKINRTSK